MEIDQHNWLKQSNRLIVARYRLTKYEQRLMMAICSQLKRTATEFETVRVRVSDMADFCQITGTDKYNKVHSTILKLMSRTLQIQKEDGKWYLTHWLQSAEYLDGGIIEYRIDQRLKPELLKLKEAYLDTPAAPLMEFRRDYSARLYFILKKMIKINEFDYDLDFFRDRFQLGKTYDKFSNLKNGVLEPALAEINDKSDISVQHEYIKEGRAYTKIHFIVSSKTNNDRENLAELESKGQQNLFDALPNEKENALIARLAKYEISDKTSKSLIKKYGIQQVENNLMYAYTNRKGKASMSGWVMSCIKDDLAGEANKAKEIAKAEEEREKQKQYERFQAKTEGTDLEKAFNEKMTDEQADFGKRKLQEIKRKLQGSDTEKSDDDFEKNYQETKKIILNLMNECKDVDTLSEKVEEHIAGKGGVGFLYFWRAMMEITGKNRIDLK